MQEKYYPKLSLIISSYNQLKRLKFCLQSALSQSYSNYEVILADDHSTDGTIEYVKQHFPTVIISLNPFSEQETHTLALNWNAAAKIATGDRFIFSNGDNLYCKKYVESHADPILQKCIIFGPNEQTTEEVAPLLEKYDNHIDLIKNIKTINRDLRHDDSAYTYNQLYNSWYPWGNNFSIPRAVFEKVGGFPHRKQYAGEDKIICDKASEIGTEIRSNYNTYTLHLWHPICNDRTTLKRIEHKL